jgi:hypothetical protein
MAQRRGRQAPGGNRLAFIQKNARRDPPPLYPTVENPPQIVAMSGKRRYEVQMYQELSFELQASPFYLSGAAPAAMHRYTDRYRIRANDTVAMPAWLPSGAAAEKHMPLELRRAKRHEERQANEAKMNRDALLSTMKTPRGEKMASDAAHKAALISNWNADLNKAEEDFGDENEGGSDEGSSDEDYNDYTVDYYDEDHDAEDDETGAGIF